MRLRALAEEPPHKLIGEAAWRGLRSIRQWNFSRTGRGGCPIQARFWLEWGSFRPIGYHRSRDCAHSRSAIVAYADAILRGEYPLMGYGSPRLGANPDWHCDWVSGRSWPLEASRDLVVVRHDGSDVKAPWELSRLQFAPLVAHAYVLTGNGIYREAVKNLLTHWVEHNRVGIGVNWTIAMEAALRGISLCLSLDLLWPFAEEEQPWLLQMTASLRQHLRFIEAHNEFSFLLRSNHYLSNIVGLTTLSAYLGLERRREKYARAVQREILLQTYADGGDREASTGYHVLVAELALHTLLVQQRCGGAIAPRFEARLSLMFQWIAALADDAGKLPLLGDCDNGRVELMPDDIDQAERHSLRTGSLCRLARSVLPVPAESAPKDVMLLRDSGIGVLHSRQASVIFSAVPNGLSGKGSHTHCDKLSIVFRLGGEEVFSDSGSRCYTRSAKLRNLDRSTRAHNTLMIDEADQNIIPTSDRSLFQCGKEAKVSSIEVSGTSLRASHSGYARLGAMHLRTVTLSDTALMLVDQVDGTGMHSLDIRFMLGPEWRVLPAIIAGKTVSCIIGGSRHLTLQCEAESSLMLEVLPAEISREFGSCLPATCIHIQTSACLPASVQTRVTWD